MDVVQQPGAVQELPDGWASSSAVVRVRAGARYAPPQLPGLAHQAARDATQRATAAGAQVQLSVGPEELIFLVDCSAHTDEAVCLRTSLQALATLRPVPAPEVSTGWTHDAAWWVWAWQGHPYQRMAPPLDDAAGVGEEQVAAGFLRDAWSLRRWHVHHGSSLGADGARQSLDGLPVGLGPDEAMMRPLASMGSEVMHHPELGEGSVVGFVGIPRDLTPGAQAGLWRLWACVHPDASPMDDLAAWSRLRATDPVWMGGVDPRGEAGASCDAAGIDGRAERLVPSLPAADISTDEARRILEAAAVRTLHGGAEPPTARGLLTWPDDEASPNAPQPEQAL